MFQLWLEVSNLSVFCLLLCAQTHLEVEIHLTFLPCRTVMENGLAGRVLRHFSSEKENEWHSILVSKIHEVNSDLFELYKITYTISLIETQNLSVAPER